MMKIIRMFMTALVAVCLFAVSTLAVPHASYALLEGSKGAACDGANLSDTPTGCDSASSTANANKVNDILKTVLTILSLVVAIISVFMIIIGGIRFVTSQGDGSSTAAARNTIIYAVIGLVVAAIAQALVQFVVGRAATPPAPAAGMTVMSLKVRL
jgi:hypothetical protein